ncbi:MAG: hypothetical protein M3066_15935 [Actinomycetota bacterium]|nr:hypothetical protein [Actinomycetota bacterium]
MFPTDVRHGIRAPVLYAQGQYDAIWCGGTGDCNTDPQAAKEWTYYSPGVSFSRVVVPGVGHSVNSSINAPQFYGATFSWLKGHGLD